MKLISNASLNGDAPQVPYSNFDEAKDAAIAGKVWGVIHFSHNFTEELLLRQADGNAATKDTILGSQIGVTLDWSSTYREKQKTGRGRLLLSLFKNTAKI